MIDVFNEAMIEQIKRHCKARGWSKEYEQYWIGHMHCEISGCKDHWGKIKFAAPPHHIKSRGAGGTDEPENLIALCSDHHTFGGDAVHRVGWKTFVKKYPEVKEKFEKAMKEKI
jgi:hypothetical protein